MISSSKRSQTSSLRSSVESKQRYEQKSRRTSFVENLIFEYKTQSNKKPLNQTLRYDEQSVSLKPLNSKSKAVKSISKQNFQSYQQSSQKIKPQITNNESVIHFPLRQSNGLQSYKSTQIKQESSLPVHNMTSRKSGSHSKKVSLIKHTTGMDSQYESQMLRNIYYNNNINNTRREQLFKKPKGRVEENLNFTAKISKQQSLSQRLRDQLSEGFDRNVINCIEWLIAERRQDGLNLLLSMKKSLKDFVLGAANYCTENSIVMQEVQFKQFISLCLYDLFIVNGSANLQQSSSTMYSNKVSEKLQKKYLVLRCKLESMQQSEQQYQRIMVIEAYYLLTKVSNLNRVIMIVKISSRDEQEVINKIVGQIKQGKKRMRKISNGKQEWDGLKLIQVLYQMADAIIDSKEDYNAGNIIQWSKTLLTYTVDLQQRLTQKQQHTKQSSHNLLYLSLLITKLITQTLFIISNRTRCQLSQSTQFVTFNELILKQTFYCNALRENLTQSVMKSYTNSSNCKIIANYLQYLKNIYRTKVEQFVLLKTIQMAITESTKQTQINNNLQSKLSLLKCIVKHLEPQIKHLDQYGRQLHFNHNQNVLSSVNHSQTISLPQIKDQYLFCAIYFARIFVSYYQILQDIDCMETKDKAIESTLLLKRVSILQALRLSIGKIKLHRNYMNSLQLWVQGKVMEVYYQLGEISSMREVVIQWFAGRLKEKGKQKCGQYSRKEKALQTINYYYQSLTTQSNLYSLYISYKSSLILSQLQVHCNTNHQQIDQYKQISKLSLLELISKVEGLSWLKGDYQGRSEQLMKKKDLQKVFMELWQDEELCIEQQQPRFNNWELQSQQQLQIAQSLTLTHLSMQLLHHSSTHQHNSPSPFMRTFADEQSDNQSSDYSYDRSHNTVYENDEINGSNSQIIAAKCLQLASLTKPPQYHTNCIKSTLSVVATMLSQHKFQSSQLKRKFTIILDNLKEDFQILLSYLNDDL